VSNTYNILVRKPEENMGGQNNGSIKKLRNRICVGYTEITSVGRFFHLFTLCSAHVSALVIALSDSSMTKSENRRLVQS
jgi:hypothetical protein